MNENTAIGRWLRKTDPRQLSEREKRDRAEIWTAPAPQVRQENSE